MYKVLPDFSLLSLVKYVAEDIQSYLIANYCPTLESLDDQALCEEYLAGYYAGSHGMLVGA